MEDNNQFSSNKADNQKEQEPKKEHREKMSSTYKVAMITAIVTLLVIAILLILVLFGMKKCQGNNQANMSSKQPIDAETNAKINKTFLDIVDKQMTLDGYDTDELKSVVAVTYEDSDVTFDINIIVSSESKVYFYNADAVNKTENINFLSYLLEHDTNKALDGNITLSFLEKTNDSVQSYKASYKGIISRDSSDNKYVSGFTYEEDGFRIYLKTLITEGQEPFNCDGDQKIVSGATLFNYYRGLLVV